MHLFLAISLALSNPQAQGGPATSGSPCAQTAALVHRGDFLGLRDDLLVHLAGCINLVDDEERDECIEEAWEDYVDALEESDEQYEARLDLCDLVGGGAYDPEIEPDDFVSGIDNPYFRFP